MRVGIFGGTFDPIHCGHLSLAEQAKKLAQLDQVLFITSVLPPHKTYTTHANFLDRHAMVALALAGQKDFIPSSLEFERSGKSYSVDTIRHFRETLPPDSALFFLIGLDAFVDISTWKEHNHLLNLCDFLVFSRPGFDGSQLYEKLPAEWVGQIHDGFHFSPQPGTQKHGVFCINSLQNPLSATVIRDRIKHGKSVQDMVPPAVEEYIGKTGLYR
jgi:nicotinate-nucleotide adenylyltransferase